MTGMNAVVIAVKDMAICEDVPSLQDREAIPPRPQFVGANEAQAAGGIWSGWIRADTDEASRAFPLINWRKRARCSG